MRTSFDFCVMMALCMFVPFVAMTSFSLSHCIATGPAVGHWFPPPRVPPGVSS